MENYNNNLFTKYYIKTLLHKFKKNITNKFKNKNKQTKIDKLITK